MDMDSDDLTVEPGLVAHTAGLMLDAGLRLDEQSKGTAARGFVHPEMFGGLGDRLADEVIAGSEDAGATLATLVAVLQGDADRLYRTAFAAQDAQEQSKASTSTVMGVPT